MKRNFLPQMADQICHSEERSDDGPLPKSGAIGLLFIQFFSLKPFLPTNLNQKVASMPKNNPEDFHPRGQNI